MIGSTGKPGPGSEEPPGTSLPELNGKLGYNAVMIACLLGAVGCAYGVLVGTLVGLSPWEWATIPLMGVVSSSIAWLLWRTGERYLTSISVFIVVWLSFYLLSNLTNTIYVTRELNAAFIYLPWFPVLFAFIVALFQGRLGIHLSWVIYSGVALILLRAAYIETRFAMDDPWTAAVVVSLIALPTFITLLYAVAAFREQFAASHARSRLLAEHANKLEHIAYHDGLTGLPNRKQLENRLIARLSDKHTQDLAVHHIDLDGFKDVNDSHGHAAGDMILRVLADRLQQLTGDNADLARVNADEFVIVQQSMDIHRDATQMGERILALIYQPLHVAETEVRMSASVGTALWTGASGGSAERRRAVSRVSADLLSQADMAMLAAKQAGGNAQRLSEPAMLRAADRRLETRTSLRRALANGEFELYYQPQINMATGELVAAEALIRWHDPINGLRSPADFIPIAEESGSITDIGHWVLAEACRTAAAWPTQNLKIEVNISPTQIDRGNLLGSVQSALAESGLAPERLDLELTESVFARTDDAHVRNTFSALKSLGVGLVVDDFGTGYSSLLYLKRFPITMMKIDRAFTAGIENGSTDYAIVKAIITLSRAMGVQLVAEGIETEQQRDILVQEGCVVGQGFRYGKPINRAAFQAMYFPDQASTVNRD
ncbi:MAG: bifunctional diguanylate cyclase/phosphodiesterase [Ectothiorhodospiraceae bacterium]|nr:bifunctional diguanylate cyclase/phosphodiesterase [Ectothiorhodospiraceae bacterium]